MLPLDEEIALTCYKLGIGPLGPLHGRLLGWTIRAIKRWEWLRFCERALAAGGYLTV